VLTSTRAITMDTIELNSSTPNDTPIIQLPDGISARPYRLSDAASASKHLSPKVWKNLRNRIPMPYTEADALAWITFCHDPKSHVKSGPWTLETGSQGLAIPTAFAITVNDECVGSIGLDFRDDIYFRSAELGYWLGEEFWGKGIMSKVVPAFVEWGWKSFGILLRINGETAEKNEASGRVLGKAGFRFEGRREGMICEFFSFLFLLMGG
jgi:[ribosomal protein S5]-alanine N-acetyltransferase